MNVLVVGSGGREHALVWKLRKSPAVRKLYCAPGNAGISRLADLVPIKQSDIRSLQAFARQENIDLTVVGPEQPLIEGIVDLFESQKLPVFGPTRSAARLEGSKVFSKDFMKNNGIPTARYKKFSISELHEAGTFIDELNPPIVVKADGLAAGKGVLICENRQYALDALQSMMMDKVFGEAGERAVVEEFLEGEEASIFVLTDGSEFSVIAPAQDHKRIFDGDKGKNTGGMGAYAPAPIITEELKTQIVDTIVAPTLEGMQKLGSPYQGCLYVGLMITIDGPKVLEYNCRFGDPETQAVLPLIQSDAAEVFNEIAHRRLAGNEAIVSSGSAACVVLSSRGYPDSYETGKEITGLDEVADMENVVVFHAGTKREGDRILTSGGRVLGVTAFEPEGDLKRTISKAYKATEMISFEGIHFRRDIGSRALKRLAMTA